MITAYDQGNRDMSIIHKLKPRFWRTSESEKASFKHLFNFRRLWKVTILVTSAVALIPLIAMTIVDYNVSHSAVYSSSLIRTTKLVSNTWRTIQFFLTEHKLALDFIVQNNEYSELTQESVLTSIKASLGREIGGVTDLSVIDTEGRQLTYTGPFDLQGQDYSNQNWFKEVKENGFYISEVFMGFRKIPHIVIAVKQNLGDKKFFVLRSTLDTQRFNRLLSQLDVEGHGDTFIINKYGLLQTPSRFHGDVLSKVALEVPSHSESSEVYETVSADGTSVIVGYSYIPNTPFILMVTRPTKEIMKPWQSTRIQIIGFLAVSITVILIVILGTATYLINAMYDADRRRLFALHEMEYSNKMASIGRLAAGVAHEINNPLAIINEKAGLVKDLFKYSEEYTNNPRLLDLIDSIIHSVDRCGTITKRLLSFARHGTVTVEEVDVGTIVLEVLGFLGKESEYLSITIDMEISDRVPRFYTDKGKLQQIILNLITNAFRAMSKGGNLRIHADMMNDDFVVLRINDTGCGIPREEIEQVFEPFYSTKTSSGGTGLGLAITYTLIQELGGKIDLESEVNRGTTFIITLPIEPPSMK